MATAAQIDAVATKLKSLVMNEISADAGMFAGTVEADVTPEKIAMWARLVCAAYEAAAPKAGGIDPRLTTTPKS